MLKVLIVEDEEIIREGLKCSIDWLDMGCTVIDTAKDGKDGLEKIIKLKPDVVITDIKMPYINGLEMIKMALEERHFYSIILTSYSEFDYAYKAIKLNVSDYIFKPIDGDELAKVIGDIKNRIKNEKQVEKIESMVSETSKEQDEEWKIIKTVASSENYYVQKMYGIIKKRYSEKISINMVAEELDISSSYLSRKIKEATGSSFVEILNLYRVRKAISLLEQGSYKIWEVSDKVGFSEYKNFCIVFKKYVKVSPSKYIKNDDYILVKNKDSQK